MAGAFDRLVQRQSSKRRNALAQERGYASQGRQIQGQANRQRAVNGLARSSWEASHDRSDAGNTRKSSVPRVPIRPATPRAHYGRPIPNASARPKPNIRRSPGGHLQSRTRHWA